METSPLNINSGMIDYRCCGAATIKGWTCASNPEIKNIDRLQKYKKYHVKENEPRFKELIQLCQTHNYGIIITILNRHQEFVFGDMVRKNGFVLVQTGMNPNYQSETYAPHHSKLFVYIRNQIPCPDSQTNNLTKDPEYHG